MGTVTEDAPRIGPSAIEAETPSTLAEGIAWEYIAVQAAVIWLVSRLALMLFTYFSLILTYRLGTSRHTLLIAWYRWDAINYVHIGTRGYYQLKDAAFFPLFPLLINLGSHVFGNPIIAAMVLNNLGTLAAFIGLALLAMHEGGNENTARWSVMALLSWPLAFFLAAAYTEGIFLAFAVWCLLSIRRGNWFLAATFAFLAALTHATASILFLPMLYEFARQHGWIAWLRAREIPTRVLASLGFPLRVRMTGELLRESTPLRLARKDIAPLVALISAIPLGLSIFSIFCWLHYGDPLEWIHVQIQWNRVAIPIWETAWRAMAYHLSLSPLGYWQGKLLIDSLPFAMIIVVTVIGARRLPMAYTLYLAGLIYVVLASPSVTPDNAVSVESAGRLMLAAIPAFLLIGKWAERYPSAATFFLYGGMLLQAAFLAFFLNGGLIT